MRRSRHLTSPQLIASYEVSLPVAISPGCQQDLLDVIVCESFLGCLSPCPGGPTECPCLVLPQCHRPSPRIDRVGFPLPSANAIFPGGILGLAPFPFGPGLLVSCPVIVKKHSPPY